MSSDEGSTDEYIKRKRPIGDAGGENIFLKSRKTSRTPTKKAQSSETKLDQLLAKLKQIKKAKVYINDDLSVIEREKQKQIRRKANEETGNRKDVKIGYNRVIIDGVEWRWDRARES
ncbi:hypothetical protein ILUMI_14161 [Ignelater luminosus]|uniref:Uncharacterized protein n=1 Tax=Ignelater luminosus TaxID=2038154 RepID=A0A8K0CX39_IGNLU|nr:hypothetical protein ILUMI_14161 [Ignelater luminosus]